MDNNNMPIDERRREKVQSFRMHISDEDLAVGEKYRENEGFDVDDHHINSFSDDDVRVQIRKDSKNYRKKKEKERKREERFIDRRNKRLFRTIWWVSVGLVGIMFGMFLMVGVNDLLAIGRSEANTVTIKIPQDPTLDDVCEVLHKKGVISEPGFFGMYATITKNADSFTQGKYEINTNMDYEAIINYLQSLANRTDTVTVTIPEGQSVIEIANRLKKAKILNDVDKFLELCNSDEFDESFEFLTKIKNKDKRYYKLEGYLFPDTYECYVNEDPEMTIRRMLNVYEMRTYTDQYVEGYKNEVNVAEAIKKTDYSMDEILTIASIIQAEAANKDDMYKISSVLHNRLEYGESYDIHRLDCDSTSFYPY
ncbi:MAG: endolytic transglycosylase MltG, partial [Ruminococcus sp.]